METEEYPAVGGLRLDGRKIFKM